MHVREMLYIDGRWARSTGSGTIAVFNSATEEVIGTVPDGTPEDVDRAVRAASNAFPEWSRTSVDERSKLLARTAELLAGRQEEIANLVRKRSGCRSPFRSCTRRAHPR